jgi:hypothetical protein
MLTPNYKYFTDVACCSTKISWCVFENEHVITCAMDSSAYFARAVYFEDTVTILIMTLLIKTLLIMTLLVITFFIITLLKMTLLITTLP